MPYVGDAITVEFEDNEFAETPGELNYLLTQMILKYVSAKGLSYQTINDISGAMTEALAEFRRRVTQVYEDRKIRENGDVYPADLLKQAYGV